MVSIYHDPVYDFYELFNHENGNLIRFDSNDEGGMHEPFQRSFPELIDVGIMGHCTSENYRICSSAGIKCYQRGAFVSSPNMTFDDYCLLLDQIENKTFQVSLGGAGDPNKHPIFEAILSCTREKGIVPNMTTSGVALTTSEINAIKKYCGGVAVSWYSRLDSNNNESNCISSSAVKSLVDAGCTVNIHYVINPDNMDDINKRLEENLFPSGINAVIFLLHKPVGLGVDSKSVFFDKRLLSYFFSLISRKGHPFRIGFDTCFAPLLRFYLPEILPESIDYCEAARFSMYVDSQLNAYPCSFGIDSDKYKMSLKEKTIDEVWNSDVFEMARKGVNYDECSGCNKYPICRGSCLLGITNICMKEYP